MKSSRCTLQLLCALLVIGSLDTIPDPPAVNPHTANLKASCPRVCVVNLYEQRLHRGLSGASHLLIPLLPFTNDHKPRRLRDWIVLTGQAADPSPPV